MEEQNSISIKSWYARGWNAFKENPKNLILGSLVLSGLSVLFTLGNILTGRYWVLFVSQLFIIPVLGVGWLYLCLLTVRGKETGFAVLFSAFRRYGRVWVTYILFILLVVAGVFLIIVPGVLWALRYGMSLFAVMDTSRYARNAFRYSKQITKGSLGKLFVAALIAVLLSGLSVPFSMGLQRIGTGEAMLLLIFGVLPFLAGVLVISPWVGSSIASAYESLAAAGNKAPEDERERKKPEAKGTKN
jgi:hypothetical protein